MAFRERDETSPAPGGRGIGRMISNNFSKDPAMEDLLLISIFTFLEEIRQIISNNPG